MMQLEPFLSDRLREVLTDRRVLTAFDPARRLLEVARSLAGEKCRVIEVGDDIITGRAEASVVRHAHDLPGKRLRACAGVSAR